MEIRGIDEVELIGEEGGRIVVSNDLWAGDPDRPTIALRIMDADGRAVVRLDDEETNQLRGMIAAQVPVRKFEGKGITFRSGDHVLVFRPSNMGEPYREGFDVTYGIDKGHYVEPQVSVFLQDDEMLRLGEAIDKLAEPAPPRPHAR
jgi:hypothetical protein